MILIFGGTTEGRMAIDVCEEAGKPFYYSTKSAMQQVEMHHGVRLCGAMSVDEIISFCKEREISCIIDAAHPFAENLHKAIAATRWPVIRLQRSYGVQFQGVIYCHDYADAIEQMTHYQVQHLLALSGANTIQKLKPFWQQHHTTFRILNRAESKLMARECGLSAANLVYYNEQLHLPSVDSEKEMMQRVGCDAIITKESGESGGFEAKVRAALQLGLKVFVVQAPAYHFSTSKCQFATGRHTLRRAIQALVPEFFPLKTGLTTGACATAATKAALLSLLTDECPEEVSFALPDGEVLTISVECSQSGEASVVKDYSDDPDVLKGCRITARISPNDNGEICFLHGEGVGRVTLPGLGIPVGEPAINPTPRKMITDEIRTLSDGGFDVQICVAQGRELAQRTFNPKVGVVDGISIIGTSGIVSPLSNEAFIQSIGRELQVAKAIGYSTIGIASGKKGEEAIQEQYPGLRVIHYGNFIGETLKQAHALGFQKVVLGIMIGKAVKLSEGHLDTHSHKVTMNKEFLRMVLMGLHDALGNQQDALIAYLSSITMARELWNVMPPAFFDRITALCYQHCKTVFPEGELEILLICDKQV